MEFAFIIPLVALLLVGVVEVAAAARTSLHLISATREGARAAAVAPDPARAIAATQRALGEELASRVRITVERPSVTGRPAKVTVRLDHQVLSLLGGFTTPLEFSSTMRVER